MFVSLFFVIGRMNEFAVVILIDRTNRKTNHGRPNFSKLYSPKKRSVSFNKISTDVNDTNSVNTLDTPLMTNATKNLPCLQTKLILHHYFFTYSFTYCSIVFTWQNLVENIFSKLFDVFKFLPNVETLWVIVWTFYFIFRFFSV